MLLGAHAVAPSQKAFRSTPSSIMTGAIVNGYKSFLSMHGEYLIQ